MIYFKSTKEFYGKFDLIGDDRTENWLLVKDWWPTICISIFYLIIVKMSSQLMRNRPPFNLTYPMIVYNISMVFLSIYIFSGFLFYGLKTELNFSCWLVSNKINKNTIGIANIFWWFYFSKIIELSDTIFFITRKKFALVTILHVYHHAVMPTVTWLGIRFAPGGVGTIAFMLNSFVHIFMYLYYALAAAGPRFRKYLFWKQYMTILQIVQFIFIIIHSIYVLRIECKYPKVLVGVILANSLIFLILFSNFYRSSYKLQCSETKKE